MKKGGGARRFIYNKKEIDFFLQVAYSKLFTKKQLIVRDFIFSSVCDMSYKFVDKDESVL